MKPKLIYVWRGKKKKCKLYKYLKVQELEENHRKLLKLN